MLDLLPTVRKVADRHLGGGVNLAAQGGTVLEEADGSQMVNKGGGFARGPWCCHPASYLWEVDGALARSRRWGEGWHERFRRCVQRRPRR